MSNEETRPPVVWIISSEQWPRALLRAELIERGLDAVGYLTIDQALMELLRRPAVKPQAIILDLNAQIVTRELLFALEREAVPTVILGGSVELSDPLIAQFRWAGVLKRPFTLGDVAAILEPLVRRGHRAPSG